MPQGGGERGLEPVGVMYLDLVISRETIHEREGIVSRENVDNLVDEWVRVIFLWTGFVQITKIGTNAYGALFFHDGSMVGNP